MKKLMHYLVTYTYLFMLAFSLNSAVKQELPFVVVICSMNNAPWVEKNLDSVFNQTYSNFRVIYIDDASQDGTADAVQQYIDKYNLHHKITFIRNEVRARKLKNEYLAFQLCEDNEIIVQLDGDDWYAHSKVLSNLNNEYLTGKIWLTYGSHKNFPTSKLGSKSSRTRYMIAKYRLFRKRFIYMPTRSFYAWLVKLIKLEDFINDDIPGYEGLFYPTCDDALLMWTMLEMAHYKFKYLSDVSYIANRDNPNITIKTEMDLLKLCSKSLRKKIPLYPAIRQPIVSRMQNLQEAKADVIVLSRDPVALDELLLSVSEFLKNKDTILVLFEPQTQEAIDAYQQLAKKHSHSIFVDIKLLSSDIIQKHLRSNHCLMLHDAMIFLDPIDCCDSIKQLEMTFAHNVHMALQENDFMQRMIPCQNVISDLYAWKFSCDKQEQLPVQSLDAVLYRKRDIENMLTKKHISMHELQEAWHSSSVDRKKVGLFYKKNRVAVVANHKGQ